MRGIGTPWVIGVLLVLVASCSSTEPSGGNGRCAADGSCEDGYRCDVATQLCVPANTSGCTTTGIPEACATCNDDCTVKILNATAVCEDTGTRRVCTYESCSGDAVDLDGDTGNGCECVPEAEVPCNGADEDCDGADERLSGTVEHCARCGDDCTVSVRNATGVSCSGSSCDYAGCLPDFGDADGYRPNGCECRVTGAEVCDGADNDCNGAIDDEVPACACNGGSASLTETCNGIDDDCNEGVDDVFPCIVGQSRECDAGQGPRTGLETCDAPGCDWSGVCVSTDHEPPATVTDFTAGAGDTFVLLAWTYPSEPDLAECVIRRSDGAALTGHLDGEPIATLPGPVPGTADALSDDTVVNDTTYEYAIFCRDVVDNWQDAVVAGGNRDIATPFASAPAGITDLVASDGEDGVSTITFTTPAPPMDDCVLLRTQGGYAAGPADATAVSIGGPFHVPNAPVRVVDGLVDGPLANGEVYYYAAFCARAGLWNGAVVQGANADTGAPDGPPQCGATETLTVALGGGSSCRSFAPSQLDAELFHFTLATDCDNVLTGLSVELHPASNTTGAAFAALHLVHDASGDGVLGPDDTVAGTATSATRVFSFTGLDVPITVAATEHFFLVADFAAVSSRSHFAWRITGGPSITLAGNGQGRSFTGGAPLVGSAHSVGPAPAGCSIPLGPGSFAPPQVRALTAAASGWNGGQGDEAAWTQAASSGAGVLDDCDAQTSNLGSGSLIVTDRGTTSTFLHIDTGIPVGLPLCGVTLRVVGSEYNPPSGACDFIRTNVFSIAHLFSYTSASRVAAASWFSWPFGWAPAGMTLGGCFSDYADLDLSALYAGASGTSTFNVRLIFDVGAGISADENRTSHVGEVYVRTAF